MQSQHSDEDDLLSSSFSAVTPNQSEHEHELAVSDSNEHGAVGESVMGDDELKGVVDGGIFAINRSSPPTELSQSLACVTQVYIYSYKLNPSP